MEETKMANVILNEKTVDFDACVNLMDAELMEAIHMNFEVLDEQSFLGLYCEAHFWKYGEVFSI